MFDGIIALLREAESNKWAQGRIEKALDIYTDARAKNRSPDEAAALSSRMISIFTPPLAA